MIRIAVDAMGGDNAPEELVAGAVEAVKEKSEIKVLLIGQEDAVNRELSKYTYNKEQIEVVHASEVIATEEPPVNAVRKKKGFLPCGGHEHGQEGGRRTLLCQPEAPGLSW